ncbi:hypothetical protein [Rhodococcus sp. 1168]|uniref:hypothetical protein n=1 Tax=Rhodococcus sp. 1168 TaxID=2018041 RepID=UPI000A0B086A|nr:hypothetical protein [Rhodococcus sp. 1168]ORI13450.1 hypothetical protein BJI47_22670 [Rhodococcus sp. 1168]
MSEVGIFLLVITASYLAWWAWDERDFIRDLFTDLFGGRPRSAKDAAQQWAQIQDRIDRIGKVDFPGYGRFEAWTQCPTCDRIAVHGMRKPKPKPVRGPIRVIEREDGTRDEVWAFSGMTTTGPDESKYDTIRTCECGQEWGQK